MVQGAELQDLAFLDLRACRFVCDPVQIGPITGDT